MRIFTELALAAALFAAMAVIWKTSARVCFTPVPRHKGIDTYVFVVARGDGGGLEQTAASLRWLDGAVKLGGKIVIVDAGLDENGEKIARFLSRDGKNVYFTTLDTVCEVLGN
ncbi:MAG: hypothetical protein LBS90_01900 [Oscillospiraceae bacterium]|jgi:hypothetical protein|nr:hypothetical protein [Oscillospiraceae bacterium]